MTLETDTELWCITHTGYEYCIEVRVQGTWDDWDGPCIERVLYYDERRHRWRTIATSGREDVQLYEALEREHDYQVESINEEFAVRQAEDRAEAAWY